MALGALADDPPSLVMGCRQLVDHQPTCGPLWWLCARVLAADDVEATVARTLIEFHDDPTPLQVSMALADADDPLVVTAAVAAPRGALVQAHDPAGRRLGSAISDTRAIWLVAGVGRVVAGAIFDEIVGSRAADGLTFVPADDIDRVIGPRGAPDVAAQLGRCDAPVLASLMRRQ